MAEFILSAFADEGGSTLDEQIAALKENGIRLIEPRNINGKGILDLTEEELTAVKAALDKAGIRTGSIGSPIGKTPITCDFDEYLNGPFAKAIRAAEILGTDKIRMFSFFMKPNELDQYRDEVIARLTKMVAVAKEHGITLCHENEANIYGELPERVADLLDSVEGLYGICDPANYRMANADTESGLNATLKRFAYMHIKDADYTTKALLPAGEGEGKIPDLLYTVNAKVEGRVMLTVEPHLFKFIGYSSIDKREMKGAHTFRNNRESFAFAVNALKKMLATEGYTEGEDGVFRKTAEEKKIRFGIVGFGNMGTGHAKNLSEGKVRHGVLAAVCDTNPAKIAAAKATYGDKIACFDNAEDMFRSGLVDVVQICTPHYFHPTLAMLALDCGVNCIVEKPAGVYTKQVKEMIDHAEKSDKILGIMFNQRTNPAFRKMRDMVKCGAIGEIKRTNWIITDWYRTQQYYDSGSWRATWSGEGGGVLYNQAPHQLDLFQWIVGMMPSKVHAFCHFGKWHDIEVEDDVTCYCEYPNGATGVFITTTADAPGTNRFEITGTKGTLIFENNKLYYRKLEMDERIYCFSINTGFAKPPVQKTVEVPLEGENTQHVGICENVARAILGIEPLYAPAKDGLCGVELANAMHLSSWTNGEVSLPIDDDLFYEELKKRIAVSKPHFVKVTRTETQG